jgi:hypothetical protein
MFKLSKHTLIAAVVIAAASAPSAASARVDPGPSAAPASSVSVAPAQPRQAQPGQAHLSAQWQTVANRFRSAPAGVAGPRAVADIAVRPAVTAGFHWDDAGVGAAAMLGILAAAVACAALTRRRHGHQSAASSTRPTSLRAQ